MAVEKTLIDTLKADATVNAITTKVGMQRLHEGKGAPAVVLTIISESPVLTMGRPVETVQARVQIDCFSKKYAEAANLADAIRNALHLFEGNEVEGIVYDGRRTLDDKDTDVFSVSQDFFVFYNANP